MSTSTTVAEDTTNVFPIHGGKPWKIVIHERPDTDAYMCAWGAWRFLAKKSPECELTFVRAGERISAAEAEGYRVIHLDTGRGQFDQHEKFLVRGSSFQLFVKEHKLDDNPAVKLFMDLTIASDNVEKIDRLSLHYLLKGLWHQHRDPKNPKEVNWLACIWAAFYMIENLYGQITSADRSKKEFDRMAKINTMANGLTYVELLRLPNLRGEAHERNVDVVMWTVKAGQGYYPAVQLGKNAGIQLYTVLRALREEEARKRNLSTKGLNLASLSPVPGLGAWFLHDSGNFIGCGTNTHPLLKDEEFTKLSQGAFTSIVRDALGKLIPQR